MERFPEKTGWEYRWLLPRLARFQEQHESIQVRLTTAQADVNFAHDDVDAAIMIGRPDNPALHYDHLFDAEMYPVCSPAYRDKLGSEFTPQNLQAPQLLQVYPSAEDWPSWLEAMEE